MITVPFVPSPKPYAWDTGQNRSHWDTGWDSLGTLGSHGDEDARKSDENAAASWDIGRDKSGTRQQKPCPRLLRLNIPVGTPPVAWAVSDWRAFFDERAGILEYDAGLDRKLAERGAFQQCVVRWLERHPAVKGFVEAWPGSEHEFRLARVRHAVASLRRMGIRP